MLEHFEFLAEEAAVAPSPRALAVGFVGSTDFAPPNHSRIAAGIEHDSRDAGPGFSGLGGDEDDPSFSPHPPRKSPTGDFPIK